jgi:hypothetical protein
MKKVTKKKTTAGPAPPKDLGRAGKELWRRLMAEYRLDDAGGQELLRIAAQAADRAESCRQAIAREGAVIVDRLGTRRPHPLLPAERQARHQVLQALRTLNLGAGDQEVRYGST